MPNTLIAFAAKAGAVANDGDAQNSPFAVALLKHIAEPGLDLRLAFGRVRDDVLKSTGNRQEPFVYGSLGGETVALVPQLKRPPDAEAEARVDYELAAQVGTKEAWDSFLVRHPTGFLADLARGQNAKLAAAQLSRAKADDAQREAAQKAAEFSKQLEEQSARQTAEAKQRLSDQAKRELEEVQQQIAEQAKKQLDDAKRQLELAQQQAEAARRQVEEAKREAVANAQIQVEQAKRDAQEQTAKVAALTPDRPAPSSESGRSPPMDLADIARLLQAHLKRVGCNPGAADGSWDDGSKRALDRFNKNAQTKFDVRLASLDALDAVRGKTDRVCPLICAKGQRAEGDRCIQIGCGIGFFLNSSGSCEKRQESAPKARATQRELAPQLRSGSSDRGKCFTFNGKTYCE
jgi:chemotaxis protein histidine kinase CheA